MSRTSENLTDLRDAIFARIALDQANSWFTNNDFNLIRTWRPDSGNLEELRATHPSGVVYVVGGIAGDERAISRSNATDKAYSVKIGFQVAVDDQQDVSEIDPHAALLQELHEVCRSRLTVDGFCFDRIEAERDANGIPFNYTAFDKHTFEAYFTAWYNSPLA